MRSADGPTRGSPRHPRRTSGRHHSAATGGCASAFATATRNRQCLLLGAAPDDAQVRHSVFQRRRKSALRRSASSRSPRVRKRAASGIPGVPPPRADVHDRPVQGPHQLTPRSASSSKTRRASWGSCSAVSPGVETTAASQRSRGQSSARRGKIRRSGWAPSPRSRLDLRIFLQVLVNDLALDRGHRLELDRLAGRGGRSAALGERVERRRAAFAVAGRVDHDGYALLVAAAEEDAFARYWMASIVWPWRPISGPRSRPRRRRGAPRSPSSIATVHCADLVGDPLDQLADARRGGALSGCGPADSRDRRRSRRRRRRPPAPARSRRRAGRARPR